MLRLSPLEQRRNDRNCGYVNRALDTLGLFQGSVPTQVRAVNDGGNGKKGKNKMTGDKGKGNGKDKNKHKSSDKQQEQGTKQVEQWSTASTIPRLLPAHITRSGDTNAQILGLCWHNRRMVQWLVFRNPESEVDGVKSVQCSDVDSDAMELDWSSWCFAAMNTPRRPRRNVARRQWCRRSHLAIPDFVFKRISIGKKGVKMTQRCARQSNIAPCMAHDTSI